MQQPAAEESAADSSFRAEALAFLEKNARPRSPGSSSSSLGKEMTNESEAAHVQECRDWQAVLAANSWAGIAWAKECHGRGATIGQARIFAQEESHFEVSSGVFMVATGMVGPTIIAHGTQAQKDYFLPRMLNGEHIWCQLFSEPGAGSDLAGLATCAVRDGDQFIVNGQKVWTSGAHFSDWAMLLVRTDSDVPKHRGITYILVDMRSPGITVRPLRQITGHAHFNEVFLTDVSIPVANVLGEINGGWGVAQTTLGNERSMIGGGGSGIGFKSLLHLARTSGCANDPIVRQELARSYTRFELLGWLSHRARARSKLGLPPGPEASVMKLAVSERVAADGDLALAIEGANGMLTSTDAPQDGMFQQMFLNQWSVRIGGGTEQIQRNVLGERVLGLPSEPRPDKTLPFKDLPHN